MVEKKKTEAVSLRDLMFDRLMAFWKNIAVNNIRWKGLEQISPDLTSDIVESQLFEHGKAICFDSVGAGMLWLPASASYRKNVYGRPQKYLARGFAYTKQVDIKDGVLIKNNSLEVPTRDLIEYFVAGIVDCEMTKKMRRNAHKTPFAFKCDKKTELSVKNYFAKLEASEPAIYIDKAMAEDGTQGEVLDWDVAYMNDKLNDEINSYKAEIQTILGIDNYVEDKAERVQSAEVEVQDDFITTAFHVSLEARQQACRELKEKFGFDISVEYAKPENKENPQDNETGGDEDEQLHD